MSNKKRRGRRRPKKIHYSFINVLTGSDLSTRRLALMKAQASRPGPVVWLTGAIHGDEVGGIVIIQEIFKDLRRSPLRCGTLMAMPLMNPIGFESGARRLPLSGEDLNRAFPGDRHGSIAERIADRIFTTIVKSEPSLVMDLHNDWSDSIPYTLIDPYPGPSHKVVYDKVKTYAHWAGFPVINELEAAPKSAELQKSLSGTLVRHHIPAISFEIGGDRIVNEVHVQAGVDGIWNILANLGMVDHQKDTYRPSASYELTKERVLRYSHEPRADASGIIRFMIKPGQVVKKGQPLARIYNVFGKPQSTLIAQRDGLVLGHTDSAVAFPGAEVVAFGV